MRRAERHPLAPIVALGAVTALALLLPTYWVYLLSAAGIGALIARGIGLVTQQTGIILLCQMSFAAIGGWAVSWLSLHGAEVPFPIMALAGGVAATPFGLLLGSTTARVRGVELAVVMLGFAAALDLVLRRIGFPGTSEGAAVIPAAPFSDPFWFALLTWILFLGAHLGIAALQRTPIGRGWAAVKESERAAASLGIRSSLAKTSALGAGAFTAGVAGALLAGQYGLLTSEVFTPLTSMVQLAIAVMFGASLWTGAALAGIISVLMPEILRRAGIPPDVGNALIAVGAFDILRRGRGGIAEQVLAQSDTRAFRHARTRCDLSNPPAVSASVPHTGGAASAPALEIEDLSVAFGPFTALKNVHLTLSFGEVHAVIGPNGAGKSTVVDTVTGFHPQASGRIRLAGEQVEHLAARERARRGIRRTFQQSRVIESLTVDEYLRLTAGRAASSDALARVRHFFGLPQGGLPIRLMDVGSRRILELAGAVAAAPRALLLDEPAAGLDDATAHALAARVRDLPRVFGCAVLLIEHDMGFVRTAADRITVLDEGAVLTSGSVDGVLEDPRVIATYLGRGAAA